MSSNPPSHTDEGASDRDPLDQAFDEFCGAWIDGQRPDVATFVLPFGSRSAELRARLEEFVDVMLTVRTVSAGDGSGSMPKRIGEYTIERELGRGGMGVVYLAHQESLGRHVALKVLTPDFIARDGLRERFQREAEAAARLRHPGIVSIHAVGEEGACPFIAMELVEGVPLHRILDRLASSAVAPVFGESLFDALAEESAAESGGEREALHVEPPAFRPGGTYVEAVCRVLIQVADALAYAHSQGVVHRDVKPSNILLRADGTVVLADFGIARFEGSSSLTRTGERPGTPQYMAPERGLSSSGLDPRVDVYSLGVVLFELLTLRRPFEGSHSAEVWHAVLHKAPPLARREFSWIPRDLATICSAAMEKDPARRYQGASELANDLRRFLAFSPIHARPMGRLDKGALWMRRHPVLSIAWGAALVCLVLGPTFVAWREHRSNERILEALVQKDEALQQAATNLEGSQQVTDVLVELFCLPQPSETLGRTVTAADLLKLGVSASRRRLATRPDLRAPLLQVLGTVHGSLGLYEDAQSLLRESVVDFRGAFGEGSPEAFDAEVELARALSMHGRLNEAKVSLEALLQGHERVVSPRSEASLRAHRVLANVQRKLGLYSEAMSNVTLACELQESLLGRMHHETLASRRERAQILTDQGEYEAAETALRELTDEHLVDVDPLDPDYLSARMSLAHLLERRGSDAEAESVLRETLDGLIQLVGDDHPSTLVAHNNLAQLQSRTGRLESAEEGMTQVLAGLRRSVGDDHPNSLMAEHNLGCLYMRQLRFADASPLLQRTLAQRQRLLGADHPDTLSSRFAWARILIWRDKEDEGEMEMRFVVARRNEILGVRHLQTLSAKNILASFLSHRGKSMEAEEMWRETRAIAKESLGPEHHLTKNVTERLAKFLASDGRVQEAQNMVEDSNAPKRLGRRFFPREAR